jgi:hypothetical protein
MSYALTPQADLKRCKFCGAPEASDRPFVAVMTRIRWSERHWVHAGDCHDGHSARCRADREARP